MAPPRARYRRSRCGKAFQSATNDLVYRVVTNLATSGARLAVAGRELAKLESLSRQIDGQAIELDATQDDAVYRCLKSTMGWGGRRDGVVNCAGSILLKPAHLTTAAEFQRVRELTSKAARKSVAGSPTKTQIGVNASSQLNSAI
ncbi:MAG: SDR family oxidoreductase [Phycisphaerales bacterium]|nr:SDR family oxidoreductase [Phycisphaerales bacterium]